MHSQSIRETTSGDWKEAQIVDLGEEQKKVFYNPQGMKEIKCCQSLHVFFQCMKIFAPFDLVSSIHALLKLQNSSL